MTPEEMQTTIQMLVEQVQELQKTVDELDYSNTTHKHTGNDGTAKLGFVNLVDTPNVISTSPNYYLKVNSTGTGITLSAT